ncbi:hypothetical protein KCV06_g51, partial [Aureobasidium melanogenum]
MMRVPQLEAASKNSQNLTQIRSSRWIYVCSTYKGHLLPQRPTNEEHFPHVEDVGQSVSVVNVDVGAAFVLSFNSIGSLLGFRQATSMSLHGYTLQGRGLLLKARKTPRGPVGGQKGTLPHHYTCYRCLRVPLTWEDRSVSTKNRGENQ